MGRLPLLARHVCVGLAGCCLIAACSLNTEGEGATPEGLGGAPEGGVGGKGGSAGKGGAGGHGGVAGSGTGGVAGSGTGGVAGPGTGGVAGSGTGGVAGSGTGGVAGSGTGGVAGSGTGGVAGSGTGGVAGAGGTVCTPQPETCNGLDDDCNGSVDDSNPGGGQACDTGLPGVCSAGLTACANAQLSCSQSVQASGELCDGLDNDCDGTSDEDDPEGGQPCTTGLPGVCAAGLTACANASLACTQAVQPSSEICDGVDDDCDTLSDEGCPGGVLVGEAVTLTTLRGSSNAGAAWSELCPPGMVLTGIVGTANGEIDQVQGRCGTLELLVDQGSTPFQYSVGIAAPSQVLALHGTTQGTPFALECPASSMVTRIFGRASNQVNQLGIGCSEATVTESGGGWALQWTEVWASAPQGGTNGGQFSDSCAAGSAARTLEGRAGATINAIRIGCHPVSLTVL